MSFILDALRRADAERSQGQVPGLQTPTLSWQAAAGHPRSALRWLAPLGAGLLLAAAAAWWWWPAAQSPGPTPVAGSAPAPAPVAMPAAMPAATVPPPGAPPAAGLPALPAPTAAGLQQTPAAPAGLAAAGAAVPASAAGAVPAPTAQATLPPPSGVRRRGPPPQAAPVAAPEPSGADPSTPPGTPDLAAPRAAVAATAPDRLPMLAELPEPLRRQLPPLQLGGLVWAETPAQRLVLVGGQVFHEGDQLQPGLVLQQIGRRAVVFSLQGQRFQVTP